MVRYAPMVSVYRLKRRRPVALRLLVASMLLALLASSMGGVCSVIHLPMIEKAVDKCSVAEHGGTFDQSSPATDDCGKQQACLALEATDHAGGLLQNGAGFLPNPWFNLFFTLVLWATFQPRSLDSYLKRPPPLPKAPVAYRFCILLN
ncbi:MAG TPA: hypothetical protein VNL74_03675 [Methylococcus sp.]|nr:hypothetical protein [Methylococcus sp.]